jgi:hypothetical protein
VQQAGSWVIGGLGDENRTPQKRGYEPKLLGYADYDTASKTFKTFQLIALGQRWGGTQYNVRSGDLEPFPMVVVLELAGDSPADHVAPAYLYEYDW